MFIRGRAAPVLMALTLALVPVAGLSGLGPAMLRLPQSRFGRCQRLRRFASRSFGTGLGVDVLGAVTQFLNLSRQLGRFRLGPLGLSPRRFQRRLGNPSLGAHCRFASEQGSKVRLRLPRRGLGSSQIRRNPSSLRFAVGQPGLDLPALRLQRRYGLGGILAKGLLARRLDLQGIL